MKPQTILTLFHDACALGWPGRVPINLKSYSASRALIQVRSYLACHRSQWYVMRAQRGERICDKCGKDSCSC